jgi:phospholipase C
VSDERPVDTSTAWKSQRLLFLGGIAMLLLIGAILAACSRVGAPGTHKSSTTPTPTVTATPIAGKIKHIVIIIKENHSFDNIFGRMPGVDGATTGYEGKKLVALGVEPDSVPHDIKHDIPSAQKAVNHGHMNEFDREHGAIQNGHNYAYSQYTQNQVGSYWKYAQTFGIADRFFSTILGVSMPNHLVLISGSNHHLTANPVRHGTQPDSWGCDSAPSVKAQFYIGGKYVYKRPCLNVDTVATEANKANVSWKFYAPTINIPGYVWNTYNAIKPIFYSSQWKTNVPPTRDFIKDVNAGRLPTLSWVTGQFKYSEHPQNASECKGQNWSVRQINAIMKSKYWKNTAIILTWDDYGGFYDHVPPPHEGQFMVGPRVPALMMSAYSKPGFVDSQTMDFRSILKYVEDTLSLPHLIKYDRTVNSIGDMLDLNQKPLKPMVLKTPKCKNIQSVVPLPYH